jgi:hypothetical protein
VTHNRCSSTESFLATATTARFFEQRTESEAASRRAWEECKDLAQEPDILSAFANELVRCGVAGEIRIAKILKPALCAAPLGS